MLADTAASFPDFVAEANRLRADLPPEVEATLRRHEEAETTDDPEYAEACQVFYSRHVCRLDEADQEIKTAEKNGFRVNPQFKQDLKDRRKKP